MCIVRPFAIKLLQQASQTLGTKDFKGALAEKPKIGRSWVVPYGSTAFWDLAI